MTFVFLKSSELYVIAVCRSPLSSPLLSCPTELPLYSFSLSLTQRLPLSNAFPLIIHIIVTLTFSLSLSPSHHHPVSTLLPISGNRLSLTQRLLALQKSFPSHPLQLQKSANSANELIQLSDSNNFPFVLAFQTCSQLIFSLSLTEAATLKSFPNRHPLELQKIEILQINI